MITRLALIAAGYVLVCAGHLSAQSSSLEYTGVELLEQCQALTAPTDYQNAQKAMRCLDYLRGIADAYYVWQNNNDVLGGKVYPPACFPEDGVTPLELAKVAVKYLNDHPNRLHWGYGELARMALFEAYPCQKQHPNN